MFWCSVTMAGIQRLIPTPCPSAPLLPALLLLMGVLGAVDALGLPPGSAGTIDWRYPDAVMSVQMPCHTNGTFQHPIFCNWYYRCYETAFFPGFYSRAFFMCAPGTEFAEPLEQCVWRGSTDKDNNGFPCSYLDDAWPLGVGAGTGVGPGTGVESGSAGGASNVVTEDCRIEVTRCRNDFLCLPEFMPRVAYAVPVRVCDQAVKTCSSTSNPACGDGKIWDTTNEVCLPKDYLCSEAPQPTATSGRPDIECRFEVLFGCYDFVACLASDTRTAIPFRRCYSAVRTCALKTAPSADQRPKEDGFCPYLDYDLFLEECENRFDIQESIGGCDPGIETFNGVTVDCTIKKTTCNEYVSCETGERFTGCSNYYHCSSSVFSEQIPCPLGQVSQISTSGDSHCLPIHPAAVPRLQGNATCVSTGDGPLLADSAGPPPRFRQQGFASSNDTRGYTRDERSATNSDTEMGIKGRTIEATESTLGSLTDYLLPTYYLDVVQRTPSKARKLASPSVPESLINLANSLRGDEKESKQVEVLPIPANDSEHTLTQIASEYFDSSLQVETTANRSFFVDVSAIKPLETNATVESSSAVQMDDPICQFVGERPLPQNFSEVLQCSKKDICDHHGGSLVTVLGCSTFAQCLPDAQGRLEIEHLSCSPGHFFVAEDLRCRDHAHYGGVPCFEESSPSAALTCSAEFEVLELPSLEFEQHCSSYSGCDGTYGEDQVGVALCSAFYQCLLEPVMSTLQPVMMSCQQPLLFSYQHLQCLSPTSPVLCS